MIELTLERAKELLAEAVAERGEDYVYPRSDSGPYCYYVHTPDMDASLTEPAPGCIAGYVLHKAGVPLETLRRFEGKSVQYPIAQLVQTEPDVADLLRNVQSRQDERTPWGEAVQRTLNEF